MAIVQKGSRVYATIKDLPTVTSITDGMKFIMQADEGTVLADFSDMSVDLDHTTFGKTFIDIVNMTGSIESFVSEVENKINEFETSLNNMEGNVQQNSYDMEAVKYFLRLITIGPEEGSAGKTDLDAAAIKFGENSETYNAFKKIYEDLQLPSESFFNDYNLFR